MKIKIMLILIAMMVVNLIHPETSIIENYLKNKKEMIELRKTRRISLEHFGNIDFFFLTDSIDCQLIELENFNFKSVELKSKLPVNHLVTLIADYEGDQRVVMIENSDELVAVDYNSLIKKSITFNFHNKDINKLSGLNKDEILLSFYINNPFNFAQMFYRDKDIRYLSNYLKEKVDNSTTKKLYRIYSKTSAKTYNIPSNSIKNFCRYQYKRIVENRSIQDLFPLLKIIALDEDIPFNLKSMYSDYLLDIIYDDSNKNDTSLKNEYFDLVLAILSKIEDMDSNGYLQLTASKIKAMQSLIKNTKNYNINVEDLFQISEQILEINNDPIVSMLAYCNIEYYYLQINDLDNALKTAIESITKFNKPILWSFYKADDNFIAKPSLILIDHLMENENDPEEIIKIIDQLIEISYSHPEFQNYLLYRKALVTELFSYSLEDVISAYQLINTDPKDIYVYNQPFSNRDYSIFFWEIGMRVLPTLKDFEKYNILLNSQIKFKNCILQKESGTINIKEDTVILVHQDKPYLFIKHNLQEFDGWVKVEIDSQIMWILNE